MNAFITNPSCYQCGCNAFGSLFAFQEPGGWVYYLCKDCLEEAEAVV
jgi:hypothetical protein